MLLVKTKLGISNIHGVGLFADENISKGTKIWQWTSGIDLVITKKMVNSLPKVCKKYIECYAWVGGDGNYYLCGDNDRFANHSLTPTCSSTLVSTSWLDVAKRNIKKGEEITYNYWEFHKGKKL